MIGASACCRDVVGSVDSVDVDESIMATSAADTDTGSARVCPLEREGPGVGDRDRETAVCLMIRSVMRVINEKTTLSHWQNAKSKEMVKDRDQLTVEWNGTSPEPVNSWMERNKS